MINDKMTPLEKCIEWMRTGGETPKSVLLHQKIAKQATTQLQDLEFNASLLKASEDANKLLTEQNDQLRKQIQKNAELLDNALQLLDHK